MAYRLAAFLFTILAALSGMADAQKARRATPSPYLFVWTGDADNKESDFLAVIDVRPNAKRYGRIVTTLPVGSTKNYPHHTEHEMPAGGILFANGFWFWKYFSL